MYLLLPKLATGIVDDLRVLAWLGWACGNSGSLGGNPYPQTWPPCVHSGERGGLQNWMVRAATYFGSLDEDLGFLLTRVFLAC